MPLDQFEDNLRIMVRATKAAGAAPVLITAPSAHMPGREPVQLVPRFLIDLDALIPLHQAYVALVRKVAQEENVILFDAAAQ